jgi:ABC-2 type transport system ATP-binding protein
MSDDPIIEVRNLTKRYAGNTAVNGLTFSVGRGEIVGFLGPNGAGKSTTMRILACYMPATSGTARVAGFDVFTEANEVRRRIGYMPENNPLHLDMRVREYLKFRARLKGLGFRRSRARVNLVMQQTGLTDVSRKIIGHLSKGYRQRVGLADALVHEPELIILDEPTIGLDPHQVRSVRQLIKNLARHHTVLLSTHILSEVEMTCNRVLILNQGRILTDDTTAHLQNIMSNGSQVVAERLLGTNRGDRVFRHCAGGRGILPLLFDATGRAGSAAAGVRAGDAARVGLARVEPHATFAGGHLRSRDAARS